MSRHLLLSVLLVGVVSLPLLAQSYQTSFSDVKFDRAKGPATFHAGVEVDAASGAASLSIPFGPGIGERGLKFRPVLSMRMAPQLGISSADENFITSMGLGGTVMWGVATLDTLHQKSFGSATFSPGTLDLGNLVSTVNRRATTFNLPEGGGGRVLGLVPAGVTPATVEAMLAKFGFAATDSVGYLPGATTRATKARFIQINGSGQLIIGLRTAGPEAQITDEVLADIQDTPSSTFRWDLPRRVAVIQGDVAYEFHYTNHSYLARVIPYLAISQKIQLDSGHYVITRMRNRFGESIEFKYDADGIGYTATWKAGPSSTSGPSIRVALVGAAALPANLRWLSDGRFSLYQATQIRVTYQGLSQPISPFLLEVSDPQTGSSLELRSGGGPDSLGATGQNGKWDLDTAAWNAAVQSVQPVRVVQEATNEEIRFSYGVAEPTTWGSVTIAPTVLSSVAFPTRTVDLTWKAYPYRMNYNPEAWGGMVSSSAPCRPAYAYGVTVAGDSDGTQGRATYHGRSTPTSNWGFYQLGSAPPDEWVSTSFYDVISHSDGTTSVHRFVEPGGGDMQNLAFLKTIEREVRYYAPGADLAADLSVTDPALSSAFKWVVKDRFDLRSVGSPDGAMSYQAVPYPTRTRTWDRESQLLTIEESTDWDSTAFGWKTVHTTTAIVASPSMAMDYLSLAQQGLSYTPYPATKGTYRRLSKTFDTNVANWFIARVKTEQTTTVEDNTGFLAPGVTLPDAQPLVTKVFHSDINRVESVAVSNGGAPTVTTAFSFQGTSGLASIQLLNAYLSSSPALALSGQLGVSAYAYDANGHLQRIDQKPNAGTTLTLSQTSDELGRPLTQTDLNGTVKTFAWDPAGRLAGITSDDGEVGTSIAYNDTDHRGITVTRGAQVAEYRYNGFGQLILERRKGPDGLWSHHLIGYDSGGRKTGETVWLPGDGVNHESDWAKPFLTRSVSTTLTTPERTVCTRWGVNVEDGTSTCLDWKTLPATSTTTTNSALYPGTILSYDGRGRMVGMQDANGVPTTTDYFGPLNLPPGVAAYAGPVQRITTGGTQVKWFEHDAVGRLVRVTTPVTHHSKPLQVDILTVVNLRTEYRYDGGDRVREVRQLDEAGRAQTRTWGYNRLGWLETLGQPESGTTTYSGFTVAGKPTVTNYNGRTVTMSPDWLGRPTGVTAADGSVAQAFVYDAAVNGKGQVARATDGGVTTTYTYAGLGKRLDSLVTTTSIQGAQQSFLQTFSYDSHGNRIGGHTSHGAWTQSFHDAAGLPNNLRMGTIPVADTRWAYYDPVSWALRRVDYGNATMSTFDYGVDQVRLTQVLHGPASGGPFAQWAYGYDAVGNLCRENDVLTGSFDQYTYDELNRLIAAVVQSPTYGEQLQQFDYDAFGNRIASNLLRVTSWSGAKGSSSATTTASAVVGAPNRQVVNAAFTQGSAELLKNRLPAATSAGLPTGAVYDLQGNLTRVFEAPTNVNPVLISMTYDALGRVLSVASTRTGLTETYQYTAEGLRTVIQEFSGTTLQKTRLNLYDDTRRLVAQYEKAAAGTLTWKRDILYLGSREAAEFDSAGMHVTMVDHLGSPRIVTGPSGARETTQKFLPFGELLEQSGAAFKTAKGYTGHEQTDTSGLIYMQARFYVPWFGRFASPDPARDQHFDNTQSWNIYSYVRNNPIMSTDPTGMEEQSEKMEKQVGQKEVVPAGSAKSRSASESMTGEGFNVGFLARTGGAESVGHLLDRLGQEAYEKGNTAGWIGLGALNATYQVLTPGGDRLSEVNARAQNGESVPGKDLAVAGGAAGLQLALTAAPQLGLSGGGNSVFWSGYSKGAKDVAQGLGTTIEKTPIGSVLDKALNSGFANTFIPNAVKNQIWKTASAMYAANAKGTAQAVIRGAGEIWTKIESKILASRGVDVVFVP